MAARPYRRMTTRSAARSAAPGAAGAEVSFTDVKAIVGSTEDTFEILLRANASSTQALVALVGLGDAQTVRAVESLAARVAEIEARPTMKYVGVWRTETKYSPGDFVTFGGGVWHAAIPSRGLRPGKGVGWTLAVKSARPARVEGGDHRRPGGE